jgi:L-lactate utilization protein LutB
MNAPTLPSHYDTVETIEARIAANEEEAARWATRKPAVAKLRNASTKRLRSRLRQMETAALLLGGPVVWDRNMHAALLAD